MSDSASPSSRPVKPRKGSLRRWVIILSAVIVSILIFFLVRTQGFVKGREFSPDTFAMRDFQFYEIPLIHLQVTPIRRASSTTDTAIFLRQKSLIQGPANPSNPPDGLNPAWHLVYLSRGITGSTPADAMLLTDVLELHQSSTGYWQKWSTDHGPEAKEFWPIIQRLAQRELYLLMPPLFELAQQMATETKRTNEQETSVFSTSIEMRLASLYHDLILDMRDARRTELADGLLAEALLDFPNDPKLRELKTSQLNSSDVPLEAQ